MLTELRIENFAIIDQLELIFHPGLITFTGETGAGKSIIIDAVELLLGGRADISMIRSGAERAMVDATFRIPDTNRVPIQKILEGEDLFEDPEFITIGREVRIGGRSVARLNGRNVNASLLKEIGEQLVDLHGQSEHLSLLRIKEHLNLLDRYSGDHVILERYSIDYHELVTIKRELANLRFAESEAARQLDILNYQINEIGAANLQTGEDEDHVAERNRLANAENLTSSAQRALIKLEDGTPESPSAIDILGDIIDDLKEISRLDKSQISIVENFENSFSMLTDLSRELRIYFEEIEFNPKRLNQVEERLDLISNLKRKYGGTIPEILEYLQKARKEKDTITHAGERIAELEILESSMLTKLAESGEALSDLRHQSAEDMEKAIEAELDELNMAGAQFKVNFKVRLHPDGVLLKDGRTVAFDANGFEQIEFLIAPNPGEGLKPLVKIASGGETSRLMLALKNVLARADGIPTLIFDEIDQGIGGRVGTIVGNKLWHLARHHQVLCVTHLPQLAAFGEQHLQVTKNIQNGRTVTQVADLREDARLPELAQMLGETTEGTMHSARDMLQTASELTNPAHDRFTD
ncbi:MAG TPA: DNA repair protein RecN [Anaerolineales bacterium]|nr:DNA repair protein RecN [Anaerolineales bacterium]